MIQKLFIALLLLTITIKISAQTEFENGYYIDKNGKTIEGLIYADNVSSTPQTFLFKSKETDDSQTINSTTADAFAVYNKYYFKLKSVLVYESTEILDRLDNKREPEFSDKTIFLEVLVQSDLTLYAYKQRNEEDIYFYSADDKSITTLVHRKYIGYQNEIKTNNSYKQQLSTELKCANGASLNFEALEYTERSLSKIFNNYFKCSETAVEFKKERSKEKLFNIKVLAGGGYSTLKTSTGKNNKEVDFGSNSFISYGGELEYHINQKRKWAMFFSFSTISFKDEATNEVELNFPATGTFVVDNKSTINSLDFNFGARRYFTVSENSSIFLGAFFAYDIISRTDIEFLNIQRETISTKVGSPNAGLSLGYQWRNLSAEFKLNTPKNHLREGTTFRNSELNYTTVTLRYNIVTF